MRPLVENLRQLWGERCGTCGCILSIRLTREKGFAEENPQWKGNRRSLYLFHPWPCPARSGCRCIGCRGENRVGDVKSTSSGCGTGRRRAFRSRMRRLGSLTRHREKGAAEANYGLEKLIQSPALPSMVDLLVVQDFISHGFEKTKDVVVASLSFVLLVCQHGL